jgi:hypothetical protein
MPGKGQNKKKAYQPKSNIQAYERKGQKNSKLKISLIDKINMALDRRLNLVFWILFGMTILTSLLLFDIRVSVDGDDSAYIIRAADFIQHFIFPSFQGPLYPIVLSPFVKIFGIHVIPLKFISLLFILGFFFLFYQAFKGRIPSLLLVSVLLLLSVNSYILYYASQTYSEALFMFLQALTFLVFFNCFIDKREETRKTGIKHYLVLSLCLLSLFLTRIIGLVSIIAVVVYFLSKCQWKNLIYSVLSFTVVLGLFEIIKFFLWRSTNVSFQFQIMSHLAKDYYNPAMGREDLTGFFDRLIVNSTYYIANYFYSIVGLLNQNEKFSGSPAVTILTIIMLLASIVIAYKKNNYLFFTGIYGILFLFSTFIIVNTYWGESRYIIPYVPLIILILFYLFYFLLVSKRLKVFGFLFPLFTMILFIMELNRTLPAVASTRQVTDKYSGLTSDWKNYCKISEWAAKNLPESAIVACRKPSISFIYGQGRRFYGIMEVPSYSGEACLMNWQSRNMSYQMILASSISNKTLSKETYSTFKRGIVAFGVDNDKIGVHNVKFCIIKIPDSLKMNTLKEFHKLNVDIISDYSVMRGIFDDQKLKISIIYPDSLLRILSGAGVTHIITANLEGYGTLERFIGYIEFKDPGIRTKIMQIGEEDDKPAAIYKLNYNSY